MRRLRLALASAALAAAVCASHGVQAQSFQTRSFQSPSFRAQPGLQPLSPADAQRYAAAFAACARGDFIDAQMQTVDIQDPSLAGYLSYDELMHPKAHKASFEELKDWLGQHNDAVMATLFVVLGAVLIAKGLAPLTK